MAKIKLVKKDKLKFKKGYFTYKGDIVAIDSVVVNQLNELERSVQEFLYLITQPEAQPEPSLEGFSFKSALRKRPYLEAHTPYMDECVEKAKKLMDEMDALSDARAVNDTLDRYDELIQWAKAKKVFVTEPVFQPTPVDTAELGNPLGWSAERLVDLIVYMGTGGAMRRGLLEQMLDELEDEE